MTFNLLGNTLAQKTAVTVLFLQDKFTSTEESVIYVKIHEIFQEFPKYTTYLKQARITKMANIYQYSLLENKVMANVFKHIFHDEFLLSCIKSTCNKNDFEKALSFIALLISNDNKGKQLQKLINYYLSKNDFTKTIELAYLLPQHKKITFTSIAHKILTFNLQSIALQKIPQIEQGIHLVENLINLINSDYYNNEIYSLTIHLLMQLTMRFYFLKDKKSAKKYIIQAEQLVPKITYPPLQLEALEEMKENKKLCKLKVLEQFKFFRENIKKYLSS